ncbi:MAG TPA: D-alanyl-D-alanine carboxypeptidase/D-alanyl-D-alanine-endopeptidase [Candidatus Acidoferrales bacterium]|nr:D-alanyl-D-alanine carboxypeptidase/D-alanyl-D-alanine-endopeptidase [Candidatus Acidoferrales bacterium]
MIALALWTLVRALIAAVMPERGVAAAIAVHAVPASAPWTSAQIARLRRALDGAFAPALSNRYSLAVIDASGRVIYANRDRDAVTPASVQKLIVANAALDLLGPRYRFHTILAATQAPKDGTLDSNLWFVGSGDPSFTSDDLRSGVRQLARGGLRRIDGAVAVDAGAMSGPEINPYWDPDDDGEDFQAPVSAVSLDGDTVEAQPNQWVPVHDMPVVVGDALDRMLRHAGIEAGRRVTQRAPLDTIVLWDHPSAPLRALVEHMLYVSDNHYAEQLMRTLALDAGERADNRNGLAVERAFLSERGIPTDGLHIVDGSGLAESDRVAAITLARILSDAQLRGGANQLYMLLPAGGRDGTLTDYDFTTALGRIRAKTGHLSDADSLAGYVTTLHHGRVSFAFLINDSPGDPDSAYVRAVDRLAEF